MANVCAIDMVRRLDEENRPATEPEQRVLAGWGGWGPLWQVFDESKTEWDDERDWLHDLLSEDEWRTARLTTINAHYTDPAFVGPIWSLVQRLGFVDGRVLEPGCGAGTFIGMAPDGAALTGVELDPVTAAIAARLYPTADIRAESFADTRFPAGHFDAAVGNVPFADVVLHDPRYNQARLSLHNHFIVKSLELVRPGGVVAVLTSRYTMDSVNPTARRAMLARADLVAAVRLPTGAHRRAAGTNAVTDLLVLRRRGEDEPVRGINWETTTEAEVPGPHGPETVLLNSYWLAHPEHVLGRFEVAVGMHQAASLEVRTDEPDRTGDRLDRLLAGVATQALAEGLGFTERPAQLRTSRAGLVPAMSDEVDGELGRADGRFYQVEAGQRVALAVPRSQQAELGDLLAMRDKVRGLIAAEASTLDDSP